MAHQSKISQLPRKVRDELNRRLDDGQLSPEILPWVNAIAEVKDLIERKFKSEEVSNQNLSDWRRTGFAKWESEQKELHFIRGAVEFSKDVVKHTGLQLTEGAAAIAAGAVLTRIEDLRRKQLAGHAVDAEMDAAVETLTTLRSGEISREHNALQRDKGSRDKDKLSLDREKFEISAAKLVLKHAQSKEVQDAIKGPGTNADKIAALRKRMFPQRPVAAEEKS